MESQPSLTSGRILGRYAIYEEIATGGMATVHLGRLVGPIGFSRTVAIKRLHPQFAKDADFTAMFMDEARLAARIRHPNVVATLDVVSEDGEIFLVMDYVQGESLSRLVKKSMARRELVPPPIVAWIAAGILHGLHAAHEAKSEQGEPLHIVHRDVSPQNILIGTDGTPRILDFGVAKAAERSQTTRAGQVKGKIAYMSPEQLSTDMLDRRTDIYAMGVCMWEALTGMRLFQGANEGRIVHLILSSEIRRPSELVPNLPPIFDEIVLKALSPNPDDRYQTAREMALALEQHAQLATPSRVGAWVEDLAGDSIHQIGNRIAEIESRSDVFAPAAPSTGSGVRSQERLSAPDAPLGGSMHTVPTPFTPPNAPPQTTPPPPPSLPSSSQQAPVSASSSAQLPAVTSSPQLPTSTPGFQLPAQPDPDELALAQRHKWKKPAMIAAVVLGFAALVAIFAAMMSGLRAPTPVTVVKTSAPATTTATPTVTASPPPTTKSLGATAADNNTNLMVMPSTTVTPKATQTTVAPPPANNCNPPYTIDKQGIKHPKPQCL